MAKNVGEIVYDVINTKSNGANVQSIGKSVSLIGNNSIPECSGQISASWSGTNCDTYIKKLNKIAKKTASLGNRITSIGESIESSAASIVTAEGIVLSIINNKI